jgi:hypothetical protein
MIENGEDSEYPLELVLEGVKLSSGNLDMLGLLVNRLGEASLSEEDVGAVADEMFNHLDLFTRNRKVLDMCLVALSNLTVVEANCEVFVRKEVLSAGTEEEANLSKRLTTIIDKFLGHNAQNESKNVDYSNKDATTEADPWAHVASIICNICRTALGRKAMMKTSLGYVPKLALQFRSHNLVRRQGCVGAIRTCLFDADVHWWMLNEAGILYPILHPLVVATAAFDEKDKDGMDPRLWLAAEDKNKKYEPDVGVRKMLLECLVLLCQSKPNRNVLRNARVYPIVRDLDLEQDDDGISEVILDIVNFLMRDEEGEASAWDNLGGGDANANAKLALKDRQDDEEATGKGSVFGDMGVD